MRAAYIGAKVYFDGSHYVAIPNRKGKPRSVVLPQTEEKIEVTEVHEEETVRIKLTRKEIFNALYDKARGLEKHERKAKIIAGMSEYFADDEETETFVKQNLIRKKRNATCRWIRLLRKSNLQDFNYFVTFTYDGSRLSETEFQKKLRNILRNQVYRKGWRYFYVWERSPEKERLHVHGLFKIPEGSMPGEFEDVEDYSTTKHCMQIRHENTYFRKVLGKNHFGELDSRESLRKAVFYIIKYLEKSGEKIVYSKGLPQYFKTDIIVEDVVCCLGEEKQKLLLFDDFTCIREGEEIGRVGPEVITKMEVVN